MFFQKNLNGVFQKLHEQSDYADKELHYVPTEEDKADAPELEKNDMLALIISAIITFVPAALLVMAVLGFLFYVVLT